MPFRRPVVAAIALALAGAGCASLKSPEPFGNVESTRPDKKNPEGSSAYRGKYFPGVIFGT
jgi:hypothetical protein